MGKASLNSETHPSALTLRVAVQKPLKGPKHSIESQVTVTVCVLPASVRPTNVVS